jgi:MoxR-like ATPase
MLKVKVTYPLIEEEKEIYKRNLLSEDVSIKKVIKKSEIFWIQSLINEIFISDSIFEYVMNIIDASRYPEKY